MPRGFQHWKCGYLNLVFIANNVNEIVIMLYD